jgi:hypothetical protein
VPNNLFLEKKIIMSIKYKKYPDVAEITTVSLQIIHRFQPTTEKMAIMLFS